MGYAWCPHGAVWPGNATSDPDSGSYKVMNSPTDTKSAVLDVYGALMATALYAPNLPEKLKKKKVPGNCPAEHWLIWFDLCNWVQYLPNQLSLNEFSKLQVFGRLVDVSSRLMIYGGVQIFNVQTDKKFLTRLKRNKIIYFLQATFELPSNYPTICLCLHQIRSGFVCRIFDVSCWWHVGQSSGRRCKRYTTIRQSKVRRNWYIIYHCLCPWAEVMKYAILVLFKMLPLTWLWTSSHWRSLWGCQLSLTPRGWRGHRWTLLLSAHSHLLVQPELSFSSSASASKGRSEKSVPLQCTVLPLQKLANLRRCVSCTCNCCS